MISSISNIFRVPELRKSIMITIGFLLIYRVGWNIPIPGVDIGVLKQLGEVVELLLRQMSHGGAT